MVTFFEGSCAKARNLTIWLHLLINVLSTVLLAASNYCMQCLSSPTRAKIDRAHARHRWLDIGVPSVRNLFRISRSRALLWSLLALSSFPLHLLYNCVVISTPFVQEYTAYIAAPDLWTGSKINWTAPVGRPQSPSVMVIPMSISDDRSTLDRFRTIPSTWDKLSNEECIKAYARTHIQGYGDVVVVSLALNSSVPMLIAPSNWVYSARGGIGWHWMCSSYMGDYCTQEDLRRNPSAWALNDMYAHYPVQYCFSEPVQGRSKIQLSIIFMVVVILCNAVKVLCMFLTLRHQLSAPLVTIGDAIQSFLQEPDPTTEDMCWADKYAFSTRNWKGSAKPWHNRNYFWFASASTQRWLSSNIVSIVTIIVAGILFHEGLNQTHSFAEPLRESGFGELDINQMVRWSLKGTSGLLVSIIIANSPQLFLSYLFLAHNALFTYMLLAEELNGYAHERKPLRVSTPVGEQRSTYRLQLPYKYSIPLLVALALLHWLVSQSLFLGRITAYTGTGEMDIERSLSNIHYSIFPLVFVLAIASLVVLVPLIMGFRRFKPGLPLIGSNSAAISAACHAPVDDVAANEKPLRWGVLSHNSEDRVKHCSFTSFAAVTPPVDGEMYAGQWTKEMIRHSDTR
ncbi:MAG: hypothetical protein Q9219_002654 [cf. Caloplaca sp. 3 TL-2023]